MGSKRQIVAVALLAILLGAGGVGFSWKQEEARTNIFAESGYVHIADPEQAEKRVAFQGGAPWRKGLSDTIVFEDTQGNQQKVSTESFAH